MKYLDRVVTDFGGIALRYGSFYGDPNDQLVGMVRKHRYPMIGDGGGVSSWVHLDDAAAATVLVLDHPCPTIYNVVDDEPAATRDWLPVLAEVTGAMPPRTLRHWWFGSLWARTQSWERPGRVERPTQRPARAWMDPAVSHLAAGFCGRVFDQQQS